MICNINLRIDIVLYIYFLHIKTIFGNYDGLAVGSMSYNHTFNFN